MSHATKDDDGSASILASVGAYYTEKIRSHGPTARGADWRDEASQILRFDQLMRAIGEPAEGYSLTEIGCGYGALVPYLRARGTPFAYVGCDVSTEMVEAARRLHANDDVRFLVGSEAPEPADYVIASGIFNVRFGIDDGRWLDYVTATVERMVAKAKRAVAFNVLTGYSDAHFKEPRLWYPAPGHLMDQLVARYGFKVVILHDYPLYEYTLAIRTGNL